jgi:hypothetical protein
VVFQVALKNLTLVLKGASEASLDSDEADDSPVFPGYNVVVTGGRWIGWRGEVRSLMWYFA